MCVFRRNIQEDKDSHTSHKLSQDDLSKVVSFDILFFMYVFRLGVIFYEFSDIKC